MTHEDRQRLTGRRRSEAEQKGKEVEPVQARLDSRLSTLITKSMAKLCMKNRNDKRKDMNRKLRARRAKLKAAVMDREATMEERFEAQMKLSELPRNSARVRQRNRCELTGRPRGYYRKFKMCRNKLRELSSFGMLPGVIKASW